MYLPLLKCQININVTAWNDLSRANQIDMAVVLFAQTIVCSLCNYY